MTHREPPIPSGHAAHVGRFLGRLWASGDAPRPTIKTLFEAAERQFAGTPAAVLSLQRGFMHGLEETGVTFDMVQVEFESVKGN